MNFLVKNDARECGIYNPIVCVIENVQLTKDASVYDSKISDIMNRIEEIREKVLPSEEVQGFRELYEVIGSKVTPAGEKLLLSCTQKSSFPRYGNLVDAYNLLALETVSPFGMHDAKDLLKDQRSLIFRRAVGDETMIPSFQKGVKTIPQGDFTYGIQVEGKFIPFAWLGKEDVDSKKYQLDKKTKSLLFTAIGNKYTSLERNKELCEQVFALIKLSCPDAKMTILTPQFID